MNVSVVGSGYVGTTLAACLADLGHDVVAVDLDEDVVETINAGETPTHEAGLDERVARTVPERLRATTDYAAVRETDVTFLCLPTPSKSDGSLDTSYVEAAAASLGETLAGTAGRHVVVEKSTVLPGTTEDVVAPALRDAAGDVGVAMNPEFLSEGTAVEDFLHPDKVVVGAEDSETAATVRDVYDVLPSNPPVVETGIREAEMIKYANNAMLAARVSAVNDIGNVCKEYGIDAYEVMDAVGLDDRIGPRFLRSGLGWGGSCFPKDVDALRAHARDADYEPAVLDATVAVNDRQPARLVDLLERHLDVAGARVAVLGLAFKPGTDDVRNSRALDVIGALRERDADVVAYDPVAAENAREHYPDIAYADAAADALDGADAAVVCTDWDEFDALDFDGMARSIVADGRRIDVDVDALDAYEGLCW